MGRPLIEGELCFFARHNIPLHLVFDLNRGSVGRYREEMKLRRKLFGYNAGSCTKGLGHTIVSRSGHCMQCDTSRIAFTRRTGETGDVYLVASLAKEFVKIGSTMEGFNARLDSLNAKMYGGASDWEKIRVARDVRCCGEVEMKIQKELSRFKVCGVTYYNDGYEQVCYELFSCAVTTAIGVFEKVIPPSVKVGAVLRSVSDKYRFGDRPFRQ